MVYRIVSFCSLTSDHMYCGLFVSCRCGFLYYSISMFTLANPLLTLFNCVTSPNFQCHDLGKSSYLAQGPVAQRMDSANPADKSLFSA